MQEASGGSHLEGNRSDDAALLQGKKREYHPAVIEPKERSNKRIYRHVDDSCTPCGHKEEGEREAWGREEGEGRISEIEDGTWEVKEGKSETMGNH